MKTRNFDRYNYEIDWNDYWKYGDAKWFWGKWTRKYINNRSQDICSKCGKKRKHHFNRRCIQYQLFEPSDFTYICQKAIIEQERINADFMHEPLPKEKKKKIHLQNVKD